MDISWNTKLYCLIGDPIFKTLSPIIHNNIFKELEKDSLYMAFNIVKDLEDTINGFKAIGVQGFNITIPYKKEIIDLLDGISPEVEIIGAVNTVKNENGKFIGYNTDGEGFIKTFNDNKIDIKNKNILLLGAGGAAHSIASSLIQEKVKKIYINNRSMKNAVLLKKNLNSTNHETIIEIGDLSLSNVDKSTINIIINSTSIGMYPMEDVTPIELNGFSKNTIIYDIVYKPKNTKLLEEGTKQGFKTFDGISMLLNQAILSQEIWLNEKINLKTIKKIEGILSSHLE